MARPVRSGEPGNIVCPACQSKITSDGKTLQSRSSFLTDLIEGEEGFKKAEEAMEKLEKDLRAAKETIKGLEAKLAAQPAPQPAPKEGQSGGAKSRVGRLW